MCHLTASYLSVASEVCLVQESFSAKFALEGVEVLFVVYKLEMFHHLKTIFKLDMTHITPELTQTRMS